MIDVRTAVTRPLGGARGRAVGWSPSGRWVAVVSDDPQFPIIYLAGVEDPQAVMDLVWHQARTERDRRAVKVDQV